MDLTDFDMPEWFCKDINNIVSIELYKLMRILSEYDKDTGIDEHLCFDPILLARNLNVTCITIENALNKLEVMGYIVRGNNKIVFTRKITHLFTNKGIEWVRGW